MATSYTTLLGLALPVQGELSGTWGDTVNNYITNYLDAAVAGTLTVSGDTTLTKTTNASLGATSSQYAVIIASGHSANITITAPAASKIYTIINTSGTYTVTIRGAGPTTGVTLGVNEKAQVAWNGSDFVRIGASGGPGVFSSITNTGLTSGRVVYSTTNGLETDSANLLFNGTTLTANTLNLTNALGTTYGGTGLTSFTANGVVYASSSSVLATGSALVFDGTNLGIGGTPTSFSSYRFLTIQGANTANGGALELRNSDNSLNGQIYVGNSTMVVQATSNVPMLFNTNGTEKMRLDASGNLGIGTSSPLSKLTVAQSADGFDQGFTLTRAGANRGTIFLNASNDTLNFGRSTATSMTLDSSGNLGLGVTPSAWTSYKAIQVGATGAGSFGSSNSSEATVFANAYLSSGTFRYVNTAQASYYSQSAGVHAWAIAPSGTAGNAITFTQAMTLDASGNLLVGTTSADFSFSGRGLIEVNGAGESLIGFKIAETGSAYIHSTPSDFKLVNIQNTPMLFWTNNTERMRLDASGNLLVGTTSTPPISAGQFGIITAFASSASSNAIIATLPTSATGKSFYSQSLTAGSTNWYHLIGASGNGSTLTTNTIFIYGNGNVENANNSYGAISDIKLKENIVDASPKLDKLMQVRIRNYNLKGDYEKHKQLGVVAQELEAVFPAMVDETNDTDAEGNDLGTTTKSVKYSVFVPMLIKAMQEQQAMIQSLTDRIAQLEAKL
jgi:hypothetical protein